MKKRDRRELERYVRGIANEMGLRDWTFTVEVVKQVGRTWNKNKPQDGEEWCATCKPVIGRKYAELTFASYLRNAPRDDLRHTVVHELVHCHFYGLWDMLRRDTLMQMEQEVYDMWVVGVERHMEYGVDAMADVIAPHLPLINWPK